MISLPLWMVILVLLIDVVFVVFVVILKLNRDYYRDTVRTLARRR